MTPTREVISEASKIFGQLGFSNLMRAIRVRWSDSSKRGSRIRPSRKRGTA